MFFLVSNLETNNFSPENYLLSNISVLLISVDARPSAVYIATVCGWTVAPGVRNSNIGEIKHLTMLPSCSDSFRGATAGDWCNILLVRDADSY